MTATVDELIHGRPKTATTRSDEPLQGAIGIMIQHDYSQLPVVEDSGKPIAILTEDSIVRALNNFDVAPSRLRVRDAMDIRHKTWREGVDLLDILDDVKTSGAVLVVDAAGSLTGIVTPYDTTEYFRRRSQDIMFVQDVEETLKDFILASFKNPTGAPDEAMLHAAIEEITPSKSKELRGPFKKAIAHYLGLCGETGPANDEHVAAAFHEHISKKSETKSFDLLALSEYIELLLLKSRWHLYAPALDIDSEALRRLLSQVRKTRNDLAHFRGEVSDVERDTLRFCRDWLACHHSSVTAAFAAVPPQPEPEPEPETPPVNASTDTEPTPPVDESPGLEDTRYSALATWLQKRPAELDYFTRTFTELEKVGSPSGLMGARMHMDWSQPDSRAA